MCHHFSVKTAKEDFPKVSKNLHALPSMVSNSICCLFQLPDQSILIYVSKPVLGTSFLHTWVKCNFFILPCKALQDSVPFLTVIFLNLSLTDMLYKPTRLVSSLFLKQSVFSATTPLLIPCPVPEFY